MYNRNHVELIGHMSNEPTIRTLGNGDKVCNVNIATNEAWIDSETGKRKEKATFHPLTIWNERTIAFVEKYVHSGDYMLVEAKLDHWTTEKDGEKTYHTAIVVKSLNFMQAKESDGSDQD